MVWPLHISLALHLPKASREAMHLLAHAMLTLGVLTPKMLLFLFLLVFHYASAPLPRNLLKDSAFVDADLPSLPGAPGFFLANSFLAPNTRGAFPLSVGSPKLPDVTIGS